MHTKQSLKKQLENLEIDRSGTLMVHLSYKAIGEVLGRGETVIEVLMEYMRPGLLVLPAHTWSNVRNENPVMDVLYTPSCVGQLTEMFRKMPGVKRSLHPTHSLCAYGEGAEEYLAGEEKMTTPCGAGGAYYKLWEHDAQILLLGVNFTRNTYIHGIEEWDGAEGTISAEKTDMYVISQEGHRIYTPQYRHCARLGSETFSKLEAPALHKGILSLGEFGDATSRLISAKPLRSMLASLLKENPRYLLQY